MPSEKTGRAAERKRIRNRAVRKEARTLVTKARGAIESGSVEQAEEAAKSAAVALDKATSKGVLHPNNAARRKSRLTRRLNALKQEASD